MALSLVSIVPGAGVAVVASKAGREVKGIDGAFKLLSDVEKADDATTLMKGVDDFETVHSTVDSAYNTDNIISTVNNAYDYAETGERVIWGTEAGKIAIGDYQWIVEADDSGKSDNELAAEGFFGSIGHAIQPLKLLI